MNIFLGDRSRELLKDENALRQKVAGFLAEPEQTQNVMTMTNLLLSGHKQDKVLIYDFMQLPFFWISGFFIEFSFVYRRLWTAFFISFTVDFISLIVETIIISFLVYVACIFVFGKLHYYFLIKKFIESTDLGLETNNKCAPNMAGVIILGICVFLLLLLFIKANVL
ncbi:hypothetical protein AVANS14531_00680 [Campylobacter sp. Cr9]|uniref:hypothetical protein n=1 Tax=unclassified Campylobacter TaxID=2593542 RepID=UPI001EFB8FA9|nr:hypothetical protein [Campylobacter sp. RM5004]MBZ7984852.1 hypothetical protein [Campylobacter sp. Cr9]ULO02138.1 putative membrane protein [Campylobacter sp. RM5004]